jgi:hypothetical protein
MCVCVCVCVCEISCIKYGKDAKKRVKVRVNEENKCSNMSFLFLCCSTLYYL